MIRRSVGCVVLGLLVAASLLAAQPEEAVQPEGTPAEQFATAQSEWEKLQTEINKIVAEYRTAEESKRAELGKRYEETTRQAQAILINLRKAGVAAYAAAPNEDKEVTRTLMGLLAEDVRRDDYEAALKLAQLLIDNKAENQTVYDYAGVAAYGVDDFVQAEKWLKIAAADDKLSPAGQNCLSDAAAAQKRYAKELKIREKDEEAELPRVKMETNRGVLVIELFENEAPETVGNFVSLVEKGFYNGLTFHRVLPGFMAQGGDPDGTGSGGPGYEIYCECGLPNHREHFRGTLSMAHAGKDTGGSQFFLTFRATQHLDGRHTAFGRVIEGLDVLTKLQRRNPQAENAPSPDKIVKAEVLRKRDHKYEPRKVE